MRLVFAQPFFRGITNWKAKVNDAIAGGFDSRRHPIYIKNAITNAEKNFELRSGILNIGSTEVFKLAKNIYSLVEVKIKQVLNEISAV